MTRIARIGLLVAVFAGGYLVGAMTQPSAEAQLGDTLKAAGGAAADDALGEAAGSAGAIGQAAKLGTAIADMQENVDSLQQSLKILGTIQSALGG